MRTAPSSQSTLLLLLLFPLLFSCFKARAQVSRCGTVQHSQSPSAVRFEQWLQNKIKQKQARASATTDEELIYRIPVVVHVIHRGEEVGSGSNIPLEQIQDQIRILNEDFRRQNADTTNTRAIFLPVAADTRIEFELARRDPNGLPTEGVVRAEGPFRNYDINSDSILSEVSQWNPDQYMNLWVAPLQSGLLGFVPVESLVSLENPTSIPFVDGVVVDYRNFGSIGNLREPFTQGRTATHEVGHYLGLRHVWGDGGCGVDDFVEDTPPQASSYNGCPVEPESCGSPDMVDNYMDLTDDACMNLFTEGQKLRMRAVLESSPRRTNLLFSPALEAPLSIPNDASILRIVTPQTGTCDLSFTPSIVVRNTGSNPLQEVSIAFGITDQPEEVTTLAVDIASGDSQQVVLATPGRTNLVPGVVYEAAFAILAVNSQEDTNPLGNRQSTRFFIPQEDEVPLVEEFRQEGGYFDRGVVINPDQQTTWEPRALTSAAPLGEQSLFLNFYDYVEQGERDFFYGPTLDFADLTTATLSFEVAHAPYVRESEISQDGLLVGVSTDCGATIDEIVYQKFGETLATRPAQDSAFFPTGEDDWREEVISLDEYLGEPNVQLVFIGVNDYGNNLFLDEIEFFVTEYDSLQPAENSFSVETNPVQSDQLQVEFNLRTTDDVTVAVYSLQGQVLGEYLFPGTLNQTYTISLDGAPTGVYVLRSVSTTLNEAKRFIIP